MAEPTSGAFALLVRPALLIAGLSAAGWALRDLKLADFPAHAGGLGLASFILLGGLACAVGVPRQMVAFAGGYAHGLWAGAALALAAQLLGCLADLLWSGLVARDWVRARLAGRLGARLDRLDRFLAAHPFAATLTLRLLPVGNNLVLNLLAGAFGVRAGPFLAASALGYLPQTCVFVLLGGGVRLGHGVLLALGLATFAASTALGLVLLRRARMDRTAQ